MVCVCCINLLLKIVLFAYLCSFFKRKVININFYIDKSFVIYKAVGCGVCVAVVAVVSLFCPFFCFFYCCLIKYRYFCEIIESAYP